MGFSLKKIGKTITNVVKNPGNALEKVAKTAAAGAVGFVTTGNPVGAVAAAAREGIRQSETGKSKAFTFRSVYQGAATALTANLAAGAVAKIAPKVAGGGSNIGSSFSNFLKGGGLQGKVASLAKSTGGFLKSVLPTAQTLGGLLKKGVPGETTDVAAERADAATEVVDASGYGRNVSRDFTRSLSDAAQTVRASALDRLKGSINGVGEKFALQVRGADGAAAAPVIVNTPGPTLAGAGFPGEFPWAPVLLIGGALLLSKGKLK